MSMFAKRCTKTKLCLWAYLGVTCVDVTSDGGTILNIAISGGTNEEVEEFGARADNILEIVNMLLDAGANTTATDHGAPEYRYELLAWACQIIASMTSCL